MSKSKQLIAKCPKGTRDMLPNQMQIKEEALSNIRRIFQIHGASEIDTPVFERKEILTGQYGEGNKLVYDLADQGGEPLSLRYDLTVPFARFMATHNLSKLKRFQIGKVYRRDQPNMSCGRYREFYQCDFDIAGQYSQPMFADAEVLKVFEEQLTSLKIDFKFKLNDRRLLDHAIVTKAKCQPEQVGTICVSLDKLDKEPWDKVKEELKQKSLNDDQIIKIKEFIDVQQDDPFQAIGDLKHLLGNAPVLDDLKQLVAYLQAMEIQDKIKIDPSLARGLDYYTGMIFEAVLTEEEKNLGIGSIAAGGRYDKLIGQFSKNDIPSAGGSLGIERIFNILENRCLSQKDHIANKVDVMISSLGEVDKAILLKIAKYLWESGINYLKSIKLKQFIFLVQKLTSYQKIQNQVSKQSNLLKKVQIIQLSLDTTNL